MKIKQILFFILLILAETFPAKAWNWDFDLGAYQTYMTTTVVLIDNEGNNYGSPDIEVVAFNGDQIRGISKAYWEATDEQYVYYPNVYADPNENIKVEFKAFYAATGEPVVLENKEVVTNPIDVNTGGSIGAPGQPTQVQPGADLTLQGIRVDETVQVIQTTSSSKAFVLKTTPEGVTGFTVKYEQNGSPVTSPNAAGSYDVIISRPKDGTYQAYNRTIPGGLVIGLSAPTVTWPTSVPSVSEGSALSTVAISGGSGDGTFAWSNPDYVFQGNGTYMMEMVFTPSAPEKYYPVREVFEVTVLAKERKDITISATTPQTTVYDGSEKAFTYTSDPSVSDFTVTYKKGTETTSNPINAGTYDVTISRGVDEDYKAVNKTFTKGLVIEQAAPDMEWPTKITLVFGDKLSDAVMEGQSGDGKFTWKEADKTPSQEISFKDVLVFTPTNPNYKTVEREVTVNVKKRVVITIASGPQTFTYDGKEKAFTVTPTPELLTGFTVTYSQGGTAVVHPVNAGTYDVTVARPIDVDYNAFNQTIEGGLVIKQAKPKVTWPNDAALAKGEPLSSAVLNGGSHETEGSFSWTNADSKPDSDGDQELVFTPTSSNYETLKEQIQVNVLDLQTITIDQTPQDAGGYDGTAKSFTVTITSETKDLNGFTVSYAQGGTAVSGSPVNAGSYDVTVTRPQDATYRAFNTTIKGGLTISRVDYPSDRIDQVGWPEGLSLYEGRKLSTLVIPSSSEGSFVWETPDAVFGTGEQNANLIFVPSSVNYNNVVRSIPISVVEEPAVTYEVTIREPEGGSLRVKNGFSQVSSGDRLEEGTVLTLEATPAKGYLFSHYLVNGTKQTNDRVIVTGELILEAVFTVDPSTGIEDVEWNIDYSVQSGTLFVETPAPMRLQIIALSGTVVYDRTVTGNTPIGQFYKGIYLLRFIDPSGRSVVKKIRM